MRVKIGKYTNYFGPYQLAELLMFWVPKQKDEHGFPHTADRVHKFGEWLAHGSVEPEPKVGEVTSWDRERHNTLLSRFLSWIHSKQKRTVKVKIDPYDTWSMDDTLAHIIHPMLVQLKETKHGSGHVDDEDVPEHLRSTAAPAKENEWDTDDNWHKRWDWVLEEMIWAFGQKLTDWESQYHSGEHDIIWQPCDATGEAVEDREDADLFRMEKGPNDTHKFDAEGHRAHSERMANGFRLFGKYYCSLWD